MKALFTALLPLVASIALGACARPSAAELTNYWQKREDINPKAIEYQMKAVELWQQRPSNDSTIREAIRLLDTALMIDPTYQLGLDTRAKVYFDLGEPESGLADLAKLCSIAPRNPYVYYGYGHYLDLLGRKEQAQRARKKGIELLRKEYEAFPDSFQVVYSYATMLMHYGDLEQAKAIALELKEDEEAVKHWGAQIDVLLDDIEHPERIEEDKRSEARHWKKPYGGARR